MAIDKDFEAKAIAAIKDVQDKLKAGALVIEHGKIVEAKKAESKK